MELKQKLGYVSSLDLLRGLAAVAVAFFHFTHGNPDFLSPDNSLFIIGRYGFLGVEVFFVISGFVIPYSMYVGRYKMASFGKFMVKRVVRIEPPYLISIILVLALNYLSTLSPYYRGEGFHVDMTGLLLHLGYLNAFFNYQWINDVYWTLAIEFQYYLIIAMLFPLLISKNKNLSYIVLILITLSGIFVNVHSLFFNYAHLFVVGMLLFLFRIGYLNKNEFGTMLLIVLMLIFIKFDKRYLIAALLPYFFIMYFDISNKVSKFLGNISYSLYLVHIPIGGRVINLAENFFQDEIVRSLFVFVAMAVSIFAAWLFYLLVEKPSMKLSKKLKYIKSKK
jgi:peptidoglycan/LPS O-acetylase OafA/YrhL